LSRVSLTVNGEPITADIAPRTHLADFLREERLLTGTHLGCEHGICGACTLLIDDAPARSCITFVAACEGEDIRTIEGLEDDPVIACLREAFTAEHALQCGYCTPGMLVTARDIVLRLPLADEARIRLELAGNLCRCTGYAGITKAIQRVLADPPRCPSTVSAPLPTLQPLAAHAVPAAAAAAQGGEDLTQVLHIALPLETVWQAVQDPQLVAACVPGARLLRVDGDRIEGEMIASLGPIRARFAGAATLTYEAGYRGQLSGEGRDLASNTRMSGAARFALRPHGATTEIDLAISYALRGPLAQFGRSAVVHAFAAEIAAAVAGNLEARLTGHAAPTPKTLGVFALLLGVIRRWLRGR
jgi:carbon-monoxide dehydrogenase small subunit